MHHTRRRVLLSVAALLFVAVLGIARVASRSGPGESGTDDRVVGDSAAPHPSVVDSSVVESLVVESPVVDHGTADQDSAPHSDPTALYDRIVPGLCAMRKADAEGDSLQVSRAFSDDVHEGLHALGDQIIREHRALAGRLLQAKALVEDDLLAPANELGEDIDSLLVVTREAMLAAGEPDERECSAVNADAKTSAR